MAVHSGCWAGRPETGPVWLAPSSPGLSLIPESLLHEASVSTNLTASPRRISEGQVIGVTGSDGPPIDQRNRPALLLA
jgi:hypothetical protein